MSRQDIGGLVQLTRPGNALIVALTVVVGGVLARRGAGGDFGLLILAGLSAALVAAGGNALNDAYDVVIDMINRPTRPIPSGRVSRLVGFAWGGLLIGLGILLGWILGASLGLTAGAVGVVLWLYSARLKRMLLLGNLAVALCGGLAFLYGALAALNVRGGLIPAGFAFLIHLGREIIKDVEDEAGDRVAGARTLPIVVGRRPTLRIAAGVLLLLTAATPLPRLWGLYSSRYLMTVLPLAAAPLMVIAVLLLGGVGDRGLANVSLALKVVMLTGLLALYVG